MEEQTGYLTVEVNTENGSSPLKGAEVLISVKVNNIDTVLYRFLTDESGQIPQTALSAPDRNNSLSSDSSGPDFSAYTVTVSLKGFYTLVSPDVPVFSGILSRQPMTLVPITASCRIGADGNSPGCQPFTGGSPGNSGKGVYNG